ncbi:MAG TPA: hypothetical protein PLM49_00720 [Bacteroidales bacterium]|nr:hypothetical protein [Bacteroidales bacterium]
MVICFALASAVNAQVPLSLTTAGELQPGADAFVVKPGESVMIPETHVKMIPPEHFMFSPDLKGFIHAGTSSVMQVSEIIGTSFIMVSKNLTPEYIASQKFVFKEKEEISTLHGANGVIYVLGFSNKGVDYERLMFLAGDYHNTIWINVSYPAASRKILYDTIKESLLTAQFVKYE